jgi:CBS domain containing-hemolysin-like protein
MDILIEIFVVLGVLAYLGIGVAIAFAIARCTIDGLTWWQVVLVALFWPFAPFLMFLALINWMLRGSH